MVCRKISLSELAAEQFGAQQWPDSWPDQSWSCSVGDYVVVTPASSSDIDEVMLYRGKHAMFIRQGGASAIFESDRPVVDATDSDGDGAFDKVSYSVYGGNGWDEVTVRDVNLDAQPDLRTYHRQGVQEYWMWVENGWYQTPSLGSMQVVVDGVPRTYESVDGRFVFTRDKREGRITTP